MRTLIVLLLCTLCTLMSGGCDRQSDDAGKINPVMSETQRPGEPQGEQANDQPPPTPPIRENFEGQPQLTLFPRVGDYQPEPGNERYPFWRTFIDHLVKVSGLLQDKSSGNKVWSIRGINTIDSVGFFSPLAVEPETTYHVSFKLIADLAEGWS